MSRLIDADLLLSVMDDRFKEKKGIAPNNFAEGFMQMEKLIKEQPTVFVDDERIKAIDEFVKAMESYQESSIYGLTWSAIEKIAERLKTSK